MLLVRPCTGRPLTNYEVADVGNTRRRLHLSGNPVAVGAHVRD